MVQRAFPKRTGSVYLVGICLVVALALLASCGRPPGTATTSPEVETDKTAAPTGTPKPYWDLLPLASEPAGGWQTYRSEELGLAFQYPAVYDELDCGTLLYFEKVYEDGACTVVGFGAIRIHVWEDWAGDVAERLGTVQTAPEIQPLTAVERFAIDGVPAFRVVFRVRLQEDLVYIKGAAAAFGGRLYEFSYNRTLLSYMQCDAPPLSQEEIYEHLLSTFQFTD